MFELIKVRDLMRTPGDLQDKQLPVMSMDDVNQIIARAKAEGMPVIIVTGPLVIQQASGGGASNVCFGDHIER